ncbi:MAG: hypothetical protein KAS66_01325 [Candidatus Omnitrophica bacterium]|nr:hypothetical protein [Candidatus Omnitrophota bacterium]
MGTVVNVNLLTKEELKEYRAANYLISVLESKITYREIQQWKKEQEEKEKAEQKDTQLEVQLGVEAYKLFKEVGLCASHNEAKRLIKQGGLYLNGKKIIDPYGKIKTEDAIDDILKLQRGKKRIFTINVKKPNINI